jgi:hypothetical protein
VEGIIGGVPFLDFPAEKLKTGGKKIPPEPLLLACIPLSLTPSSLHSLFSSWLPFLSFWLCCMFLLSFYSFMVRRVDGTNFPMLASVFELTALLLI